MVEFTNVVTGTQMWVADNRVEEYKAAGHILCAPAVNAPKCEEKPAEVVKPRKTTKKGK